MQTVITSPKTNMPLEHLPCSIVHPHSWWIFHCHVGFLEGTIPCIPLALYSSVLVQSGLSSLVINLSPTVEISQSLRLG